VFDVLHDPVQIREVQWRAVLLQKIRPENHSRRGPLQSLRTPQEDLGVQRWVSPDQVLQRWRPRDEVEFSLEWPYIRSHYEIRWKSLENACVRSAMILDMENDEFEPPLAVI
jgi:hypothetical protein